MQPVGFRLTHLYYVDVLIRLLTVAAAIEDATLRVERITIERQMTQLQLEKEEQRKEQEAESPNLRSANLRNYELRDFEKSKIKTKTKTETKQGKRPTGGPRGGLCPPLPLAGSPAFVSVFGFVLIFDFSKSLSS